MDFALLIPILGIVFGSLIFLIPIAGLTARFALKPIMESIGQFRDAQGQRQTVEMLERRVALMEEQVSSIERSVKPLVEDAEFRRKLEAPPRETVPDER